VTLGFSYKSLPDKGVELNIGRSRHSK